MDQIAKAISKNRSLTAENAHLFYDVQNTQLILYDVTSMSSLYSIATSLIRCRFYTTRFMHPRLVKSESHFATARQVRQDG
jgi:DNA repair protein RAD7